MPRIDPVTADAMSELQREVAAEIAKGPRGVVRDQDDEAAVHAFASELWRTGQVGDATFGSAAALFGAQGVVDLLGILGYYGMISMTGKAGRPGRRARAVSVQPPPRRLPACQTAAR